MTDPSLTTPQTGDAQERVRHAAERAESAGRDAAQQISESARNAAEHARSAAHDTAESQIDNAAHGLKATASRLRDVAAEVDRKDQWLQTALNRAAGGVEAAGDYLSGERLGSIVGDAQRTARRNPAAFMGGAAALGFILARLGKATLEHVDTGRHDGYSPRLRDGARDNTGFASRNPGVTAADRDSVSAPRHPADPAYLSGGSPTVSDRETVSARPQSPSHVPGGTAR